MVNLKLEPNEPPDSFHLTDALQKGLGRAVAWASRGLWTSHDVLLEGCLLDLRYDRQCEEARGAWLWEIMKAVGVIDAFREPIFRALSEVTDGLAAEQLAQFAVFYARRGDTAFRSRLRELVAAPPDSTFPLLGQRELIDLEGEDGFVFVADVRSKARSPGTWDFEDRIFIEDAISKFGNSSVVNLLKDQARSSPTIKAMFGDWRAAPDAQRSTGRQAHADRMRQISLSAAIQAAEGGQDAAAILRGWGMYASESDLLEIQDRLLQAQDSAVRENYLKVFSNRPMPRFPEQLLDLMDHDDERIRRRAFAAIAQNTGSSDQSVFCLV